MLAATLMDTYIKFIATLFLTGLSSFAFPQLARTEYSVTYVIKNFKPTKKTTTEKVGYEKYDSRGNIIEEGEFGEIKHYGKLTKNADSSVTIISGHGRNYKNLNTVTFSKYDTNNRVTEDQLWQYFNNEKSYLIYRTVYEYGDKGELIKENEFNKDDQISRTKAYHISDDFIATIDTVYNFTDEGITRVDGARRDTIYLDSLRRPKEIIHYFQGKFLYRQVYLYDKFGFTKTELRYDNKPDSLWCITEFRYDFTKNVTRRFWKVIGSTTETKQIYEYDKKRRLVKILNYSVDNLTGYTKYEYEEL
jgi:hypothetical protein